MAQKNGKFTIAFGATGTVTFEKEALFIGRLKSSDIFLDHMAVSRVHAGINFLDSTYFLINLSTSNVMTLNGRLLAPQKSDVLSEGDIIQIGPFLIVVEFADDELGLTVQPKAADDIRGGTDETEETALEVSGQVNRDVDNVLKVFWEKRSRDQDDWGSLLRPTAKPQPGKAMINWKPTRDLRQPWRLGIFVWISIIIGAVGVFAFLRYPQAYEPKALAGAHSEIIEGSQIAILSNGNSCTTCHSPGQPVENACIRCHQAAQFHPTNTRAHEEAGVTCTVCHRQHEGTGFDMSASATLSCAECHNDSNYKTYNGKGVRTAHGGSYGYPAMDGVWEWKGVYREVADAIPEINGSATGDRNEQARLGRHFHSVHVARLKAPTGMKGDARGLVSCSTCHANFDPIDRETPRQTCAACHASSTGPAGQDTRFAAGQVNCISCHVQHPYSGGRWSEFLTESALKRRKDAVSAKIQQRSE
jgi:FHA domain